MLEQFVNFQLLCSYIVLLGTHFCSDRKGFCFTMFPLSLVSFITKAMLVCHGTMPKIFIFYFGGVAAAGLSLGRPLDEPLYTSSRSTESAQLSADWWIFTPDFRMGYPLKFLTDFDQIFRVFPSRMRVYL